MSRDRILGAVVASIALEVERYAREYYELFGERVARDGVITDGVLGVLRGLRKMALGPTGLLERDHLELMISSAALTAGFPTEALTDD